ncbi:methyl-accepting chemotaxis protein [Phenylobacterium sp.]|uniref:methyl-accepting chemotaxis protein n=1 Tax=Phenylobacterium sp. TaxID=1871053 RepID=UPI0035AE2B2F
MRVNSVSSKLMLAAGATIGLLLLLACSLVAFQSSRTVRGLSDNYSASLGQAEAMRLAGELRGVQDTATAMASAVGAAHEHGVRDRATVMAMLKPALDSSSLVMGSWFFAAPNAFDGRDAEFAGQKALGSNSTGSFEPYWARVDGQVTIEPPEDTQVFGEPFYQLAAKSGKPAVTEPYEYKVGDKTILMTSLTAPVFSGGKLIGVAGLDIALSDVVATLEKTRPFGSGRLMLLSGDGRWVSHYDPALLMKTYEDAAAGEIREAIRAGKPIVVQGVSEGGKPVSRQLAPVPLTASGANWAVVVDAPEAVVRAPERNLLVGLVVGGVLIIAAVLTALFLATRKLVGAPLNELSRVMARLAGGDHAVDVVGAERRDEVGEMARAVEVFKTNGLEMRRLEAETEARRAEAEEERRRNELAREEAAAELSKVVDALAHGLDRLSGGDLTHRVSQSFAADYERLRTDFNGTLAKLQEAMAAVLNNTGAIGAGTHQISQAADDLSKRTEQQAASLEETAAALDEITATVGKTAEAAKHARTVVTAAKDDAEQSGDVVRRAVEAMNAIERSAEQISQIIGVIDEIAFQTNLLALNAGVEAARAGDAGKGFAVVAMEVRALAQRSAEAAKEIKELITTSTQQVNEGVHLVGDAGEALNRISGQVAEINAIVSEIAASAQEQATGLHQVNTAVNQMDQVTQQNAAMVEESTAASHSLAREAEELRKLMEQFHVGASASQPSAATPASRPAPSPARSQQQRLVAAYGAAAGAAAKSDWQEF